VVENSPQGSIKKQKGREDVVQINRRLWQIFQSFRSKFQSWLPACLIDLMIDR